MKAEWIELNSIEDVARAKVERWDIESSEGGAYRPWDGCGWHCNITYRGRPKQPNTVTVKLLGWFDGSALAWRDERYPPPYDWGWLRVPSEDKTIEVEP
jgi:hypothetical protein